MTKLIKSMKGYKATNKDMKCRGHQFVLGEWAEHDGELKECESGFHFCEHPSGVWGYYDAPGTRVFEVEAEDILEVPESPGADKKRVARRVRLVREIMPDGYGNTGGWNTGDGNTGDRNTGGWNTGDRNTGYGNACNRSAGLFCADTPPLVVFDAQVAMELDEFFRKYPECYKLGSLLMADDDIEFETFKDIPGITPEKLKFLHEKHKAGRRRDANN